MRDIVYHEGRMCSDPLGLHQAKRQIKRLPRSQRGRSCSTCLRHRRLRGLTVRGITRLCQDGCGRSTRGDSGLARACRNRLAHRRRVVRYYTRALTGRAFTAQELRLALARPLEDPAFGLALQVLRKIVEALDEGRVTFWGLRAVASRPTAKSERRGLRAYRASA